MYKEALVVRSSLKHYKMPAATTIIAAAGAAASAGQAIAANQRRKKDEAAIKEAASRLSGLKETDYSAGLQIPTMGYNLAQQGIQQQEASGIQALKEAEIGRAHV